MAGEQAGAGDEERAGCDEDAERPWPRGHDCGGDRNDHERSRDSRIARQHQVRPEHAQHQQRQRDPRSERGKKAPLANDAATARHQDDQRADGDQHPQHSQCVNASVERRREDPLDGGGPVKRLILLRQQRDEDRAGEHARADERSAPPPRESVAGGHPNAQRHYDEAGGVVKPQGQDRGGRAAGEPQRAPAFRVLRV